MRCFNKILMSFFLLLSIANNGWAATVIPSPVIVSTQTMLTQGGADNTLIDGQIIPFPGANHWLASVFDLDGKIVHILSKSLNGNVTPYSGSDIAWKKDTCYRISGFCRDAPAGQEHLYAFTSFAPGLIETGIKSLWFMDVYSPGGANGNELLAFVHEEREGNAHGKDIITGVDYGHEGFTRIGLAWSDDSGNSWRYLGKVIRPFNDPVPFNIQGSPYIVKTEANGDNYFYVYYLDDDGSSNQYTNGIGVSRAKVADVVNAARVSGNIGSGLWKKYYNGGWPEGGYGGRPSFPTPNFWGTIHTQAIHSNTTGRYYMPLTRMSWNGDTTKVTLYESIDGLTWTESVVLVEEAADTQGDKPGGYQYCSVVDENGAANHETNDRFFVDCMKFSQGNIGDSIKHFGLYRWTVDLNTSDYAVSFSGDYSAPTPGSNWNYQYGINNNFGNLGFNYSENIYGSNVWINEDAMKPYWGEKASIVWTAEASGTVNIAGTVRDGNPQTNGNCWNTDGIYAEVLHNGVPIFQERVLSGDSVGRSINKNRYVSVGDSIRFIVNATRPGYAPDARCDETVWDPSIRYISSN